MAAQLDEPDSPEWSQEAFELATILDNEEAADVLDYIEDAKCPVSMPLPPNGRTLLHHYARLNDVAMIELLIEKGALIDARDADGNTPALLLAKNPKGKVDALDLLFTKGADLTVRDYQSQETPLLWAAKRGNYEIVRYILDKRIRLNRAGSNSSSTTSDHNHNNNQPEQDTNAANLDELTLSRAPSNSWGIQSEMYVEQRAGERSKGRTALHNAAASGHVNIMEYLIQQRANVDTEDFDGMTPLFSAIKYAKKDAIAFLVSAGANVRKARGSFGSSLHYAARCKRDLEPLLQAISSRAGVRLDQLLNARDKQRGQTPLMIAAETASEQAVSALIAAHADVNIKANDKRTALHYAAHQGCLPIIRELLNNGVLQSKDAKGYSPAFLCVIGNGNVAQLELLVEHRGSQTTAWNPNWTDNDGKTLLHHAVIHRKPDMIQFLLNAGAKRDVFDHNGNIPVRYTEIQAIKDLFTMPAASSALNPYAAAEGSVDVNAPSDGSRKRPLSPSSDAEPTGKRPRLSGSQPLGSTVLEPEPLHRGSSAGLSRSPNATREAPPQAACPDNAADPDHEQDGGGGDEDDAADDDVENDKCEGSGEFVVPPEWQIEFRDLQLDRTLGSGAFGVVKHGTWRNIPVAVKFLHAKDSKGSEKKELEKSSAFRSFLREIQLMSQLRHPNITTFYGACLVPPNYCMVMEYLPTSLQHLMKGRVLPLQDVRRIALDIAVGMIHLHKSNIIHRDLKPSNILIDEQQRSKIADFGVSRHSKGTSTMTGIGTPRYMAPEMLKTKKYGPKVDVYSFGIILWEMATGKKALAEHARGCTPIQLAFKVAYENVRPRLPLNYSPTVTRLIERCWHTDSSVRPSFEQIYEQLNSLDTVVESEIVPAHSEATMTVVYGADQARE